MLGRPDFAKKTVNTSNSGHRRREFKCHDISDEERSILFFRRSVPRIWSDASTMSAYQGPSFLSLFPFTFPFPPGFSSLSFILPCVED
jgi:hypothetical protein